MSSSIAGRPENVEHLPMQHCTVGHLAEVLAGCQEEIISEWRLQAHQLLAQLHLDRPTITDHLPDIIAEIIRDLSLGRDGKLSTEQTRGSPPVHGVQRFHDGLNAGQVVAEYNLLREAFIVVAARHHFYVVGEAARIISHRIDEAIGLAVMAFAAQQSLMRKEQQNEHLAFIAHDLRTPLFAITLLVRSVKDSLPAQALADTEEAFDGLHRNLQRIETLVRRVMETNIQPTLGSSFQPERRIFDLWPVVQQLVFDLQAVAAQGHIVVENKVPRSLAIFADAGLISQIFQNLLGNSFNYSAHGRVIIDAHDHHGTVTCSVSDDGAGIPPEMLSRVFDKLTTDPDQDGTGLGLAIVKQIVEAHGGTVTAESTLGRGATITFTIPSEGP